MRQILLIGIVVGILGLTVITPQIGLLGYVWFGLMRPDVLAFSDLQYSIALAALTIVMGLAHHLTDLPRLFINPISRLLILMQIPIALSVAYAVDVPLAVIPYQRYMKVVVAALLIPWLIHNLVWLQRLVLVMTFSLGAIAAKFALFSLMHGGVHFPRGHGGGLIGDSNGMAIAMTMLLPMCWYGQGLIRQKWFKPLVFGLAVSATITLVGTGSRGCSVAAGCVLLLMALRSKYKIAAVAGMVILIVPAIYIASDFYFERMQTLQDADADSSIASRFELISAAVAMWKDYPLLGVGFGEENWTALASNYLEEPTHLRVHNTYLQILVDSGVFAFVLYVVLLFGTIIWLGISTRNTQKVRPELAFYPRMLQTSLFAYAVASTFYSRFDFEFVYMLLMTSAAWYAIFQKELAAAPAAETAKTDLLGSPSYGAPEVPPGPASPSRPLPPRRAAGPAASRRS
jgi:probable O-glycosylation ligase (exosortase A-associated)